MTQPLGGGCPIKLEPIVGWETERLKLAEHMKKIAAPRGHVKILEAGCGRKWGIDLDGVDYSLTGLDIDEAALRLRKEKYDDLDDMILGDLRTADLPEAEFDIIFNSNVLEHIDGARRVLDNFRRWLKPGGYLILLLPNGDSAKGWVTKVTPHPFHVFYMRYLRGMKRAGEPGFGPFPTFFDKEVSLKGIREYCRTHGLTIHAEYSAQRPARATLEYVLSLIATWSLQVLSLGALSAQHADLIFVIEKPVAPAAAPAAADSR